MGPLSEHFRSSEALAELREAELARKVAYHQSIGLHKFERQPQFNRIRAVAARFRQPAASSPAQAQESDTETCPEGARAARA